MQARHTSIPPLSARGMRLRDFWVSFVLAFVAAASITYAIEHHPHEKAHVVEVQR